MGGSGGDEGLGLAVGEGVLIRDQVGGAAPARVAGRSGHDRGVDSAGAGCGVDGSGSGVHGCLLGVCGDAVYGPSGDHGGSGFECVGGAHVALVDVGELGDGRGGGVVVVHGSSVSPCLQSRQAPILDQLFVPTATTLGGRDMTSHIQDFLQWAERDRLRSPATIKRYQTVLAQIPDPLNATVEDIEAWWSGRYDKSAATRQNELACLRTFYKWATRFDHRVDDHTRRLDAPKVDNAFPRPIGRSDRSEERRVGKERGGRGKRSRDLRG